MAFSEDLSSTDVRLLDLRPGLRLRPLESHAPDLTEEEVDDIIARTLAAERKIDARAAWPAIASQDELLGLAGRNARRAASEDNAAAARMEAVTTQYAGPPPDGDTEPVMTRPAGPRRWLRRALVAVVALAAFGWAPLAAALALLAAAVMAGVFVVALGTDRVAEALAGRFHRLHARDPDRAERFRARVDQVATAMDALLDRLPERWTTGLYMPDFSREALLWEAEAGRADPFARIADEARDL